MPSSLPTTRPTTTAHASAAAARVGEHAAAELDAGVGEREERHDHERADRVQPVLEQLEDRAAADEAGRGEQAEHDAGDRRVHAGLVHAEPQRRCRART